MLWVSHTTSSGEAKRARKGSMPGSLHRSGASKTFWQPSLARSVWERGQPLLKHWQHAPAVRRQALPGGGGLQAGLRSRARQSRTACGSQRTLCSHAGPSQRQRWPALHLHAAAHVLGLPRKRQVDVEACQCVGVHCLKQRMHDAKRLHERGDG